MQDPKSQVEMFEDDRMEAILGNMFGIEEPPEEVVPEKEEKEE